MRHEEGRTDSLEEGKFANLAVFAADFLHDDMEVIGASALLPTAATIVDGEIVYSAM